MDLSVLNREQRYILEEELVLLRLQEVGYLVSSLPKEIIDLLFKFCEANEEECLFKLGLISVQWNVITKEVMREVYRNRIGRSDRILRLFTELTELMVDFSNNKLITDKSVSLLTNLTELNMKDYDTVTGTSFEKLTKLQILRLCNCSNLKTDDIRSLSQLTELELIGDTWINDEFVKYMPNLIKLNLERNFTIIYGIEELKKLKVLNLTQNDMIKEKHLVQLTSLTSLSLISNSNIGKKYFNSLEYLTNLTELDLSYNRTIQDNGLMHLTRITCLVLERNYGISNRSLSKLTNLTVLNLNSNTKIDGNGLVTLLYLTQLCLLDNRIIKKENIEHLKNLKKLFLSPTSHSSLFEIKSIIPEYEIVSI